jgi:uncharacterized protein (DUF3084 family)
VSLFGVDAALVRRGLAERDAEIQSLQSFAGELQAALREQGGRAAHLETQVADLRRDAGAQRELTAKAERERDAERQRSEQYREERDGRRSERDESMRELARVRELAERLGCQEDKMQSELDQLREDLAGAEERVGELAEENSVLDRQVNEATGIIQGLVLARGPGPESGDGSSRSRHMKGQAAFARACNPGMAAPSRLDALETALALEFPIPADVETELRALLDAKLDSPKALPKRGQSRGP